MIKFVLIPLLVIFVFQSCNNNKTFKDENCKKEQAQTLVISGSKEIMKENEMTAKNHDLEVSCKLTSQELARRKETVLASLKAKVLEKKELPGGYAYRFPGSDSMVDELAEFVKSERACCSFYIFGLSFSGDGKEAWLNLTGPEGTKEMIDNEIGL